MAMRTPLVFSHIIRKDLRVFNDLARYRTCLSFVLPRYAGVEISSYRIVLRNFFLSELIMVLRNSDMKLYAMTMKLPHASIAQKLCDTKSSIAKSFFSSLILFSESALPRYESYTILAGNARFVTKQLYLYFPKSLSSSSSSICLACSLGTFLYLLPYHDDTSRFLPTVCLIASFRDFQAVCYLRPDLLVCRLYLMRLLNRQAMM